MDKAKRKRLEAKGWKIGNTEDFLGTRNKWVEFWAYFALFSLCFWCVGCVPTDEIKKVDAGRIQHMFDKCIEDDTIEECRVLVEFKRKGH